MAFELVTTERSFLSRGRRNPRHHHQRRQATCSFERTPLCAARSASPSAREKGETPSPLPVGLRARVLDAARSTPSPTRRMTAVRSVRAIVLAGAGPVVFYVAVLRNHALDGRPPALSACTAGGIALVAVCAWWIALGGRGVLGRPRAWLIAAALAGPVWVACWELWWSAATPALRPTLIPRPGARCLGLTLLLGLWPLAVTVYFWRNTDATLYVLLRCRIGYGGRSVRGLLGRGLVSPSDTSRTSFSVTSFPLPC